MFRPSREPTGKDDRLLVWKVRLFVVGAVLALSGMGLAMPWLVWAGIAVLASGLVLRILPSPD